MSAQTVRIPNRVFLAWKTLTKSIRMAIADEQNIVPDDVRAEDIFDRLINLAASGIGVSTLTSPTMEEMGAVHAALDEHRCRIGALEAAVYRMDAASRGANPVVSGGMRMDAEFRGANPIVNSSKIVGPGIPKDTPQKGLPIRSGLAEGK